MGRKSYMIKKRRMAGEKQDANKWKQRAKKGGQKRREKSRERQVKEQREEN